MKYWLDIRKYNSTTISHRNNNSSFFFQIKIENKILFANYKSFFREQSNFHFLKNSHAEVAAIFSFLFFFV